MTTTAAVKDKKSGSDTSTAAIAPKKPKRPTETAPSGGHTSDGQSGTDTTKSAPPKSEPATDPAPTSVSVVEVAAQPAPPAVTPVPGVTSASEEEVTPLSSTMLSAVGLAPSADGDVPEVPGDSPLMLAGLAAFRRQTQESLVEDDALTKTAAEPSQSSLMMAAAAANSAPTASPAVGSPDQATGAVSVSLNASDADGNPLTYSVTGQPTAGTLRVDSAGQYTYTPSVASRLAAATTSTPDFDSFTVSVDDGQGGVTPVTVSVPKLPAVWQNQSSSSNVTGATPYGVAMVGDLAYVANQGSNTVTVVNTKTGAVVGNPIVVGTAPTGVLANADGSKVYVTNRTSGTVSVVRTSDNVVIGSVKVGTNPEQMALDSTGTRLYVTNYGSGNVSVVDVSGQSPTLITNVAVGANPRGIAYATVNGAPRVYVTRYSSSSVAVINANTNKQIDVKPSTSTIDSIAVGANPQSITISPDGTRAYVTNFGSSSVSVINTTTNTLDGSAISVGSKPAGVALSADGSVLYVASGNDRVSVINTKTRAVVATLQIDTAPEVNYHTLVVRSDGSLVVTDFADRAVRVVAFKRGNTAPVAIANPTVGTANPTNGAVSGSINMKDWDGDPLINSLATAPTKGSVTFDPAAGTYTYTPTQAARDAAAQTPATDSFTIRATDPSGAFKDTTPVTVQISPTPSVPQIPVTSITPIHVGDSPIGMTVAGDRMYVVNTGANTVSIVDTTNNSVLGTIAVTATPSAVAATDDGKRVYVGYYDTVAAIDIDTQTNQVTGVTNIAIPDLCETGECYGTAGELADVVVSPDGRYVYAARRYYFDNGSPTAISYIDPVTRTVTSTGMTYSVVDMEFAKDGTTRVYMADGGYHAVLMEDAVTGDFADIWFTTDHGTGDVARSVSINPAGTRVYAVAASNLWDVGAHTVVVIDTDRTSPTYDTQIATIAVPDGAQYVKFSPDNTRAYVVHNGGKSVTVIDTVTDTVIGSISSDQIGGDYAALSVGPDGTLYFTNYAQDTVYAATVGSGSASQQSQFSLMKADTSSADAGSLRMMSAAADPQMTSFSGDAMPMMTAAVANSAPSAAPTVGLPETVNGVVVGSVNAVDTDGNPLTYAVQSQSAGADVKVDGVGNFTYTPGQAARLLAATTPNLDLDTFTVRISDGQTFTDVPVTVVVRPGQLAGGTPVDVDRDPSGVAFNADGSRAYVTNKYDKTVSVIDTANGAVLATIKVPYAPTAVVVNPVASTNRAYVAMTTGVAVINTSTNKLVDVNTATTTVDSIKVGASPSALAINSTGTRLYVSNGGSSTVSVVNTATNLEITKVTVGSQPSGLAVSPDDSRVYALSRYNDSVTVISTVDNKVIGSVKVGDSPRGVVVSPDGRRVYVTNYSSGTVTVLNTVGTTPAFVKTITVGTQPEGIAITKDGSLVYVANGKDTVSVIDTRTNTVFGSAVPIDSPAESGAHAIAVSGNKIYVTDFVDDYVRVVNVARVQTPPQSFEVPTQSAPDSGTGAVGGDLKVVDTDGDALSYNVITQPTKGAVTLSPKGVYTYTPTEAARQQAGPNTTDTFTVRVGDTLGASKDVTVTVPVSPKAATPPPPSPQTLPATNKPIIVGVNPRDVVVSGNYAYVATDYGDSLGGAGTIDVIDTASGQVVKQIVIGGAPHDLVVSADGTRIYTTNSVEVVVIDTATNEVTKRIAVPDPKVGNGGTSYVTDAAVSADSGVIYALREYWDSTGPHSSISKINTNTGAVTTTTMPLLNDIDITPDGRRILGASYAGVEVYDAATLAHLATVDVTPPDDYVTRVAVSPDGTRAYALVGPAGGYDRAHLVSVIDTTTYTQIATVSIPDSWDIAISPDGDTVYVTEVDGKTTLIIDPETNTVTGQFVTDQSSPGAQWVTEGPNGKVYVTDYSLRTVYVVNVGDTTPSNNVAPSPQAPTGTFDPATGRTAGNVNVVDQDGDSLRYYLLYPPSYGAVTLNTQTGDYVYTPYLTDDGYNQPYQDGFQVVVTDGNYVTTANVPVQTFVDPYMFAW